MRKLGKLFFIIHSIAVIVLTAVDIIDALTVGSWGFMMIPLLIMDRPVLPVIALIYRRIPEMASSNHAAFYILTQKGLLGLLLLILGGFQWFVIGWGLAQLDPRKSEKQSDPK